RRLRLGWGHEDAVGDLHPTLLSIVGGVEQGPVSLASHLDHGVLTQVRTQNIGDRLRTSLGQVEVVGGVTCRVGVPGYHDGQLWSAVFVDQVGGGLYVLSHGFGEGVVVVAEVVDETAAVHDHGFGR